MDFYDLLTFLHQSFHGRALDSFHLDAKHFDNVTILFSDFKGFTQVSERMTPQELVEELNTCFKAFDNITAARGNSSAVRYGHAFLDGVDTGDTLIRALALRMLAQAYGVRGLERPADSLLALAIDLAEASADSLSIVDSYADRMRTATAVGRPDLSLELSRRITGPYLTTPDSSARCTFLVNRANAYAQLSKLDSALADLQEARDISAAIGDSTILASCCAMLGAYQTYMGQVDKAAKNLLDAYRIAEAQRNPQLIAASAFNPWPWCTNSSSTIRPPTRWCSGLGRWPTPSACMIWPRSPTAPGPCSGARPTARRRSS